MKILIYAVPSITTAVNSQQEEEEVEALNLQEALKAGDFLAGCHVYLGGFSTIHMEKLRRILRAGGASRLCHLSESVTHVLLGMSIGCGGWYYVLDYGEVFCVCVW